MALLHVLGGISLLILVAVSTVIRAGIGVEPAVDERGVIAGDDDARFCDVVLDRWAVRASGPPGHLRDRMRP